MGGYFYKNYQNGKDDKKNTLFNKIIEDILHIFNQKFGNDKEGISNAKIGFINSKFCNI